MRVRYIGKKNDPASIPYVPGFVIPFEADEVRGVADTSGAQAIRLHPDLFVDDEATPPTPKKKR